MQSWLEAVKWYRKSAEQGNLRPPVRMGAAAARGNKEAQRSLQSAAQQISTPSAGSENSVGSQS